ACLTGTSMDCRGLPSRSPVLWRDVPTGRTASIKKCAVIVSGVRRQPNGVERPHVCHALRWPEEIFHHGPPCFAGMERQVELRKSKDPAAKSPCVDQKMRCHRERSEASAEQSRTTPR